jgi:O-antigen ligase
VENMESDISRPRTVFPGQPHGFGTNLRPLGIVIAFALLSFFVLGVANPFRSPLKITAVLVAPLLLIFVLPGAMRALLVGARSVAKHFTWYQGLWLLVLVSGLVFRIRQFQDINEEAIDGWAYFRIGVAGLVGLILIARLLSKRTHWFRWLFRGSLGIMAVYAALCLVSTTWSVRPAWTLYKSMEYMLDLSVLCAVLATVKSSEEFERFMNWAWTLLGLMLVTTWIGAILDPVDAFEAGQHFGPLGVRLNGVVPALSANSVGEFSAVLAVLALCRLMYDPERRFDRAWYSFLFLFSVATLIFSQTRAAIAALFLAVILLLILTRRVLLGAAIGIGSAFAVTFLLAFTKFGGLVWDFVLRGEQASNVEGLSGRIGFWQYAFQKFQERPWTGFGGFAGGRFVILPGLGHYEIPDVHSSLVESLVDVGIWGPLLIIIALISMWWFMRKASQSPLLNLGEQRLAIESLAILAIITVRCVVSGNITSHPAFAFLTLLCCAEFLRRRLKFGDPPWVS